MHIFPGMIILPTAGHRHAACERSGRGPFNLVIKYKETGFLPVCLLIALRLPLPNSKGPTSCYREIEIEWF